VVLICFLGEESFLSELSEEQANLPHGGVSPFLSLAVTAAFAGYQVGRNHRDESRSFW